jgi:uncharacterized membrane protein
MVTIFALTAALLYGSADFLGGVATRRACAIAVLPLSAASGGLIVLVAALLTGQSANAAGLGWGAAGGAVGGVGLMVFYAGLAEGPMSVVAPVSALMSTVLSRAGRRRAPDRARIRRGGPLPLCHHHGQFRRVG